METDITTLAETVAQLQASAASTNAIFAETYYFLSIPLMVLIHAGFLAYEMGASRSKNALASGIKNILAFAMIVPFFYFVGWWVYWAFPTGLTGSEGPMGISGFGYANEIAAPWSAFMGPNLDDKSSGVFFGAFVLFAATTASILSGALIERIRLTGFVVLAIVLGAFIWILAAAWGWHSDGWLVTEWGYHDFGAAGVVHMIAGFFTLGVLLNLGPRLGKFNADGSANQIAGHSMPMTLIGLMLIIAGFWGFLMACIIVPGEAWSWSTTMSATIYGTPMTLSGMTFNTIMGFAGGIIGAWMITRDPFWMMSGALGGIISCAAGLDLWYPPMAFAIGFIGASSMPFVASFLERRGIDDAVGAFAVHGFLGMWGLLAVGIAAQGYPALAGEDVVATSFIGQLVGAVVMGLLGFVPGYVVSLILKVTGQLRVPEEAEILGLDAVKVPSQAYPEAINPSVSPAE
ncbi:ammonium transporter [Pararhodobacter sp. CCB-MM2]|uniref:ammonium transporter n=1 Tax=Pararhodobacter sp. CCB-MM2 TaxID=1786003 RepID=UPI000834310F|nr:ammonium transporter [Pararhodobacter sp. CCB-MM2]MCA2012336.1 ammonium transporter [Cereibacter sphaeroides]